jgi:tyrosyl-tRNA synthetase
MSISDELMWRYIELLSFESSPTIAQWKREVAEGRNPRDIKVTLAKEIVARFHSAHAAEDAQADFERRFRHGALPENLEEHTFAAPAGGVAVTQLLKLAGFAPSTSEAQRLIEQGGVKIDGERVSDRALKLPAGRSFVLQAGKRKVARVTLK